MNRIFSLLLIALIVSVLTALTLVGAVPTPMKRSLIARPKYGRRYRQSASNAASAGMKLRQDVNPFEYSGFFNVNKTVNANLYYVFFPAQNGNTNAPVILWLQGGPGCSSLFGLFDEVGPYFVDPVSLKLVPNPHTWNAEYNLLFVDNPVGAGYSYVDDEDGYVRSEPQMASELYSALMQFFGQYPQYAKNDFYIAGESYAGKYIPAIAYQIIKQGNKIPLKGIAIGDGLTHPIEQFTEYAEFSYANGLISLPQRGLVEVMQNKSAQLIQQQKWHAAMQSVDDLMGTISDMGGNFDVYDVRRFGDDDDSYIGKFLELPETKKRMHTEGHAYVECSDEAYADLYDDMPQSVRSLVTDLLNNGVRVMLYNGNVDWIINSVGASRWIYNLPWRHQKEHQNAKRTVWQVNSQVAGYAMQTQNLIQLIVHGAGHMVPADQPVHALDMINRFINQKPFN